MSERIFNIHIWSRCRICQERVYLGQQSKTSQLTIPIYSRIYWYCGHIYTLTTFKKWFSHDQSITPFLTV